MSVMQEGPTLERAAALRRQKGSQGLLGEIGEPMSYAPGPIGLLGSALLGAQYLTGEKQMEEGLSIAALMTAIANGMKVPQPLISAARAAATVRDPQRIAYERIYHNPRELVAEAASRTAPEDPMLKRLFGVTRDDLWEISQQGLRAGTSDSIPFKTAANPKGAAHTPQIMTPRNVQRVQDIIAETMNYPDLYKGMGAWYVMDPAYQHFVRLFGKDAAPEAYRRFNTLTGMASPGSEVITELNRGTAANMLAARGDFDLFKRFGGLAFDKRGADYPADLKYVIGHPYHKTSQAGPMEKFLQTGRIDMDSAKVPSYVMASGVPEVGFQTAWPVGDAHFSRLIGLADVRPQRFKKGVEVVPNASATVPEMVDIGPWFRREIALPTGHEAVPAQAIVWGAGSGATGVTSPIGATKLELIAGQIAETARRMGIPPEEARDLVLRGIAHTGGRDMSKMSLLSVD